MTTRRVLLGAGFAAVGVTALDLMAPRRSAAAGSFAVTHSAKEWQKLLSPEAFAVLREADTETPFTSPLLNEHRKGVFTCAGCALDLFSSTTKFDSGTGWPSFWAPLAHAVQTSNDATLGMDRTEVHCSRCGGHLGHVFNDGPPPTGQRYCMNGVALGFRAA